MHRPPYISSCLTITNGILYPLCGIIKLISESNQWYSYKRGKKTHFTRDYNLVHDGIGRLKTSKMGKSSFWFFRMGQKAIRSIEPTPWNLFVGRDPTFCQQKFTQTQIFFCCTVLSSSFSVLWKLWRQSQFSNFWQIVSSLESHFLNPKNKTTDYCAESATYDS